MCRRPLEGPLRLRSDRDARSQASPRSQGSQVRRTHPGGRSSTSPPQATLWPMKCVTHVPGLFCGPCSRLHLYRLEIHKSHCPDRPASLAHSALVRDLTMAIADRIPTSCRATDVSRVDAANGEMDAAITREPSSCPSCQRPNSNRSWAQAQSLSTPIVFSHASRSSGQRVTAPFVRRNPNA